MEQLFLSGAGKYDEEKFAEILEDKAITINFSSGKDDFSGGVLATKENSAAAFDLLKTVLRTPRFETQDINRAKLQLLEALKQQQEQPGQELHPELKHNLHQHRKVGFPLL